MSRFARSGSIAFFVFCGLLLPLQSAAQPILSVSPTSLSLQGTAGSNVTSSTVRISNAGNRALKWSIVQPTATWLTVSPGRGVNSGAVTLSFQTSGLPAGQYSTSFRVEAEEGGAATVSVQISLAAATLLPAKFAVSCPSNMTVPSSNGSAVPVTYSATTSGGVAPVTVSGSPASGSLFPVGTTGVQVTAKSSDGQTASCSFTITVTSTVARLIVSCPSNMTVASSNGSAVPVTYSATTSGGVAPVTISGSPASGGSFSVGTTSVQVTSKSSDGQTASCSFTVTVTAPSSDGWTFCASEGGFCTFSGTMDVRYGANGSYFYKRLTDGTACTNAAFGDPAVGTAKQCSIGGTTATTPPPTSTSSYGPRSTITCLSGSVDIWPGTSIQGVVNNHVAGTTYCLRAGVHSLNSSITPKRGDTFVGEYGAILDGSGWSTSDATQAAFRAHNQDIDYVTIRNLVIRNMPQRGIHAYYYMADHWTIENNEIASSKNVGIVFPGDSVIRNNNIHHNVYSGYMGPYAHNSLLENNEIAYNGWEQKVMESNNVTFRNNFVHHNVGAGIWYDSDNTGILVEGNRVEDNGHVGIWIEISGGITIRNNQVRRNADIGIFISTSKNAQIHNNTLDSNFRGIVYFVNCPSVGAGTLSFDLANNTAYDNTIVVGTRSGAFANGVSYASCTSTQAAPYLNGSKNLTFSRNTYRVPSTSNNYWYWNNMLYWGQWQSLPQDAGGTVSQ